jgi:predicted extracellular nuclease
VRNAAVIVALVGCAPAADLPVAIHDLQGKGHRSPRVGALVSTGGVVTAVRGETFYLQELAPDGDDATSEGVRVLGDPLPAVGDEVTVTGVVAERRPGCQPRCTARDADFASLAVTTVEGAAVRIRARGRALPQPVILGARGRAPPDRLIAAGTGGDVEEGGMPFDAAGYGLDFYESLEGMRVQVDDALVVGPTRRGGATELVVAGDGGAGAGPRTSRGGLAIAGTDFNPERIFVAGPLPAADVGDALPGATVGVMDYDRGHFQLIATDLPALAPGGLRREGTSLPPARPGELRVATLNVHNLDPGDPSTRVAALASIVVQSLRAPDLLALEEVQDDDGPRRSGVVSATATVAGLTAAITRGGGPPYRWRSVDPGDGEDGGEPGGNIRVGFLFRSDRGLTFVDRPGATAGTPNAVVSAADPALPRLAYSPGRIDPGNAAFTGSRKPLAAELTFAGARLFVIAAHLVSRTGDQPLFGRFQPPALPSAPRRLAQAAVVAAFVRELLAAAPGANVLVLGDLNDFDGSAPLARLKDAGLAAAAEALPAGERYTYLFEGNSQPLDHVLVSEPLRARLSGFDIVHRDAEFATQVTDHDPCLVGIEVTP